MTSPVLIYSRKNWNGHIDGLLQDSSNTIADALELLQSCNKQSRCLFIVQHYACWWLNIAMPEVIDREAKTWKFEH